MQTEVMELAAYRLSKAEECLTDATEAFNQNRLANSINRSYYAILHATRALLALEGYDSKRHSTIIGYFNQNYVVTGKVEHVYHKMLASAFQVRNESDYNDFYVASREEARKQLDNATVFVEMVKGIIRAIVKN